MVRALLAAFPEVPFCIIDIHNVTYNQAYMNCSFSNGDGTHIHCRTGHITHYWQVGCGCRSSETFQASLEWHESETWWYDCKNSCSRYPFTTRVSSVDFSFKGSYCTVMNTFQASASYSYRALRQWILLNAYTYLSFFNTHLFCHSHDVSFIWEPWRKICNKLSTFTQVGGCAWGSRYLQDNDLYGTLPAGLGGLCGLQTT